MSDLQTIDWEGGLARFGFDAFRPGQREAIETLMDQRALLLVAPTGGGKSLTYQLPAHLLPGTALVISPLVALMNDQVSGLEALGIRATYLAATLSAAEVRARMAGIAAGEYEIVYVAPERLGFGGFRSVVEGLDLSLIAVDEAHCISEWGHDFRPEYMQIGAFIRALSPPRVLACTATATPVVRDEIVARLGLPDGTPQIVRGFARPNLSLQVAELRYAREREPKVDAQLEIALGGPGQGNGTAIIYAPTRKLTQEQASRLEALGWRAAAYHAGLAGNVRDAVQRRFMDDDLEIVVATNAFGMGIDRGDVRAVIHLAPPGSVEAYYQEVGRAGRDGAPAFGLMMFTPADVQLRRRLLERGVDDRPADPVIFEHKWNMFLELMRWAEGGSCRHDAILRYFGDEAETLHGCGRCDACTSINDEAERDPEEVTLIVRKALSGVARIHGRYGLTAAVKLLRGVADPRLERSGLNQTKTYGALAEFAEPWVMKLLRRCVTAGWVGFSGDQHPVVFLTEDGREVMAGRRGARLLLPPLPPREEELKRPGRKRARASRAAGEDVLELDPECQRVFDALRHHRLERSRADGVPPYVVASDRTLREIAALRPENNEQLAMAHGIGPTKIERYGEGLLAVIAESAETKAAPPG